MCDGFSNVCESPCQDYSKGEGGRVKGEEKSEVAGKKEREKKIEAKEEKIK